jgi:predicted nucleic acid-binding protein
VSTQLPPLVLDACVLINLWASRRMEQILAAAGQRPVLARQAADEALWIQDEVGHREAIPVDRLAADGVIEVWSPIDDELSVLIQLSVSLGDGEAASLAVAQGRRVAVATDDRPARAAARRLRPIVNLTSTSELLRGWSTERPRATVATVLQRIEVGASFVPPQRDPNAGWWETASAG